MALTATTKLEAVNVMMTAIGETPVNSITSSTTTDVSIAIQILDNVNREVQSVGWSFNRDKDYVLTPNTSNEIALAANVLRVDTMGKSNNKDYVERARKLWDRANHTYTITDEKVYVDIVWFLDFTEIPEAARRYITIRASRIFHDRTLGANALHRFSRQDELVALSILKQSEASVADHSIFNSYDQYNTVTRNRSYKIID